MITIKNILIIFFVSGSIIANAQAYPEGYDYWSYWKPDSVITTEQKNHLLRTESGQSQWVQSYHLGQSIDEDFNKALMQAHKSLDYRLTQQYSIYEMLSPDFVSSPHPRKKGHKVVKKTIIEYLDDGRYLVIVWGKIQLEN